MDTGGRRVGERWNPEEDAALFAFAQKNPSKRSWGKDASFADFPVLAGRSLSACHHRYWHYLKAKLDRGILSVNGAGEPVQSAAGPPRGVKPRVEPQTVIGHAARGANELAVVFRRDAGAGAGTGVAGEPPRASSRKRALPDGEELEEVGNGDAVHQCVFLLRKKIARPLEERNAQLEQEVLRLREELAMARAAATASGSAPPAPQELVEAEGACYRKSIETLNALLEDMERWNDARLALYAHLQLPQ